MKFHIYSAPSVDIKWGPDTPALGGSEMYHIRLCRMLAAKGHEVVSYTPLPGWPSKDVQAMGSHSGKWPMMLDGVCWTDCGVAPNSNHEWGFDLYHGVWIIQRDPYAMSLPMPGKDSGVITIFAAHDLDYVEDWPVLYDMVFAESDIHKRFIQLNHKCSNVEVTGAGFPMDDAKFIHLNDRNPKRIFHSCNPTRGLLPLLQIFHRAWEEDQELELAIGYGWDYLDAYLANGGQSRFRKMKEKIQQLANHPGIKWLGRLPSSQDVWREYAKSGMFVYPTTFQECFCNAVAEAQCFGAIPIVSPTFAIGETTLHGVLIPGDVDDDKLVQARFVREILGVANNLKIQEQIRVPMMKECRQKFDFAQTVSNVERLAASLWNAKTTSLVNQGVA